MSPRSRKRARKNDENTQTSFSDNDSSNDESEFFLHKSKSNDVKSVWYYFYNSNGFKRKCRNENCNKIVNSDSTGSTATMRSHLTRDHNLNLPKNKKSESKNNQTTIDECFKKQQVSVEEDVSRLICKDGFSINALSNSKTIMDLLQTKHQNNLKLNNRKFNRSRTGLKNYVKTFYRKKKKELIDKIKNFKDENQKFSMIFDEWTQNKLKFLGVVLILPNEEHVLLGKF